MKDEKEKQVVTNKYANLPQTHYPVVNEQLVERITNSTPDKNFVIIGEPGVGKTVMLFEVFDRLMYKIY